jgi:hypothetical protein
MPYLHTLHRQGYALGEASLQFEIRASLLQRAASGGGPSNASEELVLSPSMPIAVSGDRRLAVRLLGDLAGYKELPVLRWGGEMLVTCSATLLHACGCICVLHGGCSAL